MSDITGSNSEVLVLCQVNFSSIDYNMHIAGQLLEWNSAKELGKI